MADRSPLETRVNMNDEAAEFVASCGGVLDVIAGKIQRRIQDFTTVEDQRAVITAYIRAQNIWRLEHADMPRLDKETDDEECTDCDGTGKICAVCKRAVNDCNCKSGPICTTGGEHTWASWDCACSFGCDCCSLSQCCTVCSAKR